MATIILKTGKSHTVKLPGIAGEITIVAGKAYDTNNRDIIEYAKSKAAYFLVEDPLPRAKPRPAPVVEDSEDELSERVAKPARRMPVRKSE